MEDAGSAVRPPRAAAGLPGPATRHGDKVSTRRRSSRPRHERSASCRCDRSRSLAASASRVADLAARKADVAQIAVGQVAKDRHVRLMLALGDDDGNRVVDGAENAAAERPDRPAYQKRRRRKIRSVVQHAHGSSHPIEEGKLPFPACTMHADGLQDFQMGRIFHPDKLENTVGIRAMRERITMLDCTEPFTARTRRRERRVMRS